RLSSSVGSELTDTVTELNLIKQHVLNSQQTMRHFLIHVHVLMIHRKFERIPIYTNF
uniref:Uncharacterized protein n=1 Tax=Amphimedon queenslandica TaxID=400682 RepID=A0A1X7U7G5_AMPQE